MLEAILSLLAGILGFLFFNERQKRVKAQVKADIAEANQKHAEWSKDYAEAKAIADRLESEFRNSGSRDE